MAELNLDVIERAQNIKNLAESALLGALNKVQLSEVCKMIVYANKVLNETKGKV